MDRIVSLTGRWCVWLAYIFPLSTRFLDESFRDDEAEHTRWGVNFYVGLGIGLVMAVTSWKSLSRIG